MISVQYINDDDLECQWETWANLGRFENIYSAIGKLKEHYELIEKTKEIYLGIPKTTQYRSVLFRLIDVVANEIVPFESPWKISLK